MKNTIKNTMIAAVILSTVCAGFVGCKRGEGDPFLSLRSRKARVAGDWTLSTGKTIDMSSSGSASTTTTTDYTATTATENIVTVPSTSNPATSWAYTSKSTFEKDGTFTQTVVDAGVSTTYTGVWNFTSGVGKDMKNKSQLVLTYLTITQGSTSLSYTGVTNDVTFDIYQLKNKEMILKQKYTSSSSGGTSSFDGEWTMVQ